MKRVLVGVLALTLIVVPAVPASAAEAPIPSGAVVDSFDGATLGVDWEVLNSEPAQWSLTERPGYLRVHSLTGDTHQATNNARNLFFQDIPAGDFEIVAKFEAPVTLNYQGAGILAWQDADNYVRAALAHVGFAGGVIIENALEVNAGFASTFTPRPGSTSETLKVARVGNVFTTSYWDGAAWVQAAQVTAALNVQKVGVYALSAQNGTPITADFDYVAIVAPDGQPVVPEGPFALEGADNGPYLTAGRGGAVVTSSRRSATQLALRAGDGGTLTDVVSGRTLGLRDGRVVLGGTPAAFTLVDAGGGKVRVAVAGGYLDDHLRVAAAGAKFVVRPYSLGGKLSVDGDGPTTPVSDRLYGIFYEDINQAADGGLYAELVRNRSFEFNTVDNPSYTALTGWSTVERDGASAAVAVTGAEPLNDNNLNHLSLQASGPGAGVRNAGYNSGIAVRAGASYDFSVWARTGTAGGMPLAVTVESADGATVYGRAAVTVASDTWTRYTARLTATGTTADGRLAVVAGGAGTVKLDMVSLFPGTRSRGARTACARTSHRASPHCTPSSSASPAGASRTSATTRRSPTAGASTGGRRRSARSSSGPPTSTSGATTSRTASGTSSTSSSRRTSAPRRCRWSRSASTAATRTVRWPRTSSPRGYRTHWTSSSSPTAR
ncbi:hypothetical protein Prum_025180 [Phytohabitans rumicis]|uniref:CBM-cenC domain-containing protein n=1 Tax=Phytohabitans rumicis TaxID=1076125 RepID=A0A6V8L407_9ACTN|nr:hypothetical protein Prum_025180 [Phytohabitans rumicis]